MDSSGFECVMEFVAIGFNPSEFILSTTSMDKTIKVYDIEDFELIATTLPDVNKVYIYIR